MQKGKLTQLKEYLNKYGVNMSTRVVNTLVKDYNNYEMPISKRIDKIIEGKELGFIVMIKKNGGFKYKGISEEGICNKYGKIIYFNTEEANKAISKHKKSNKNISSYKCDSCYKYHITSSKGIKTKPQ